MMRLLFAVVPAVSISACAAGDLPTSPLRHPGAASAPTTGPSDAFGDQPVGSSVETDGDVRIRHR
jgi:hypothetical protein